MTTESALAELEALGTAQNRKVYARHGVDRPQFGVSFGNLNTLKKQIKKNHALALELWQSGNHDARVFATMIADPKQADEALLDAWVQDLDNYVITDAFSTFVGKTSLAQAKAEVWIQADNEWTEQAGWNLIAHLALKDQALPNDYFEPLLGVIEREIHTQKNRVRYAMNNALIAIGSRSTTLKAQALSAADAIGAVEVDHGETGCKTPLAAPYIEKVWARKKG